MPTYNYKESVWADTAMHALRHSSYIMIRLAYITQVTIFRLLDIYTALYL